MSQSHLLPEVLPLLDESDEVRINFVQQDRWINYPKAEKLLKIMERLFNAPRKTRVKSLLIVGESNAGKSSLKDKFIRDHPEYDTEDGSRTIFPILSIEAPETADRKGLCIEILKAIGSSYSSGASKAVLSNQVIDNLEETQVKILLIDEIQNFLAGGHENRKQTLNLLRRINNKKISIVAFGVPDALKVIAKDPTLSSRFKREFMPKWDANDNHKLLKKMLVSLELTLPLKKPSNLSNKNIMDKLIDMSEGLLGEIVDILVDATIEAIETGQEQITPALLDSIGWIKPSEREDSLDE